jgi:DNA processing protein
MERDELAAWLRLVLTPGLGNVAARRLLATFGLPGAIFAQDTATLAAALNGPAQALATQPPGLDEHLATTLQWLAQDPIGRAVLTLGDREYPPALLHMHDPPLLLFRLGQPLSVLSPAVAVVGSRNPTPQGLQNARRFARAFTEAGVTVVSGLALGVDGAAHEGALDGAAAGMLATIAVVGTGLDRLYPSRHLDLAHRIAGRGSLLSEYLLGTPPLPDNFPRRNRIIAGLGQGTLVVEAALQSGSLITARLAAEQGKEVFAIPGSIQSPQARGCHALLRQGAKLVETAQDVLEDLRLVPPQARELDGGAEPRGASGAGDDPLLAAMGYDPIGLDALIDRTGIPIDRLQAALLELELAGHVARLPGGLFQRIEAA